MAYFTELKLDVLQDHASRWANAFPKVTSISLHQYHGHQKPPAHYRYAVIFELETEAQEKQEDGFPEAFDIFAYDYFYGDLFKKVYNSENINPHYKEEWSFFLKYSNEKWPDFAPEKPCWQLFPIEHLANGDACDKAQSIAPQTVSQNEPAQERGAPEQREVVNFFTRDNGDYWRIGFEGRNAPINHYDGLLYISYLLKKPGESISCQDLYQAALGKTPEKVVSPDKVLYSEEKKDQELNMLGSSKKDISDYKERGKIFKKFKELWQAINKIENLPDNERTQEDELVLEESKKEEALLKSFLKERNFPDKDKKRVQVNVQKRLDTAYKAIDKAAMKKMAKHLRYHIRTDGAFGLRYIGDLNWDITIK